MARAIVEYSLPTQYGAERDHIRKALRGGGFKQNSEARWEASGTPVAALLGTLQEVLNIIERAGSLNAVSIRVDDP
jgi:hypothetical protein